MRWINAEKVIRTQIYDDEYEEWTEREMTIEEFLDAFTDEGCPTVVAQPAQQWIPCSEPPEDDRSVFIAYGNEKLKSCCIGFYDPSDKCWREQKNFFASLIYDAKYWCDMPELPERWYE